MFAASDSLTVWGWLALAGIAVVLALVGYGVIRLNRRQRARQGDQRRFIHELPPDLRFKPEPLWFRVVGIMAALTAGALGAAAIGVWGFIGACALVLAPFRAVAVRHRKAHQKHVIARVRDRAPTMTPDELSRLIEGLELSHGRAEMRPLRGLVNRSAYH